MNLNFETDGLNFNNKGKPDEIATPIHICKDMSNLFDYTNCNQKIWMDIFCKTGNTLEALKENGVSKNNIAAVCNNKQSQMLVCRKLYGELLPEIEVEITVKSLEAYKITRRGQVYLVSSWQDTVKNNYQDAYNIIKFVILKEMEKTMSLEFTSQDDFQINNIIMNPPYNPNDLYIDFALLAKSIATDSVVSINPSKFSGKDDKKSEIFREQIVPYMKDIVYYMDESDVFMIKTAGGICYYLADKERHDIKKITNKNDRVEEFNSVHTRNYTKYDTLYNFGAQIVDRLRDSNIKLGMHLSRYSKDKRYIVSGSNMAGYCNSRNKLYGWFSTDGNVQVTCKALIYDTAKGEANNSSVAYTAFSSDTLNECESFNSYIDTKFVRFMVMLGFCTTGCFKDESWRFVPDPGKFDHIFTDAELYQKYDLTDEEIAIIESVIKERK